MYTANLKMFVLSYVMSMVTMFLAANTTPYVVPTPTEPDTVIEMRYVEEGTCVVDETVEITEPTPTETEPVPTIQVQETEPTIDTTEPTALETEPEYESPDYTDEDLYVLACIIAQEDGGGSEYSKLLIGNVVRNRVESDLFPDTYYGVATQDYQYGMMWSTGVNWPDWVDDDIKADCYAIAERILNGETVCPANVVFQAEFEQGSGVFCKEGVHYFCYI